MKSLCCYLITKNRFLLYRKSNNIYNNIVLCNRMSSIHDKVHNKDDDNNTNNIINDTNNVNNDTNNINKNNNKDKNNTSSNKNVFYYVNKIINDWMILNI